MKTLLTLKRFNQNMELIEQREQESRSWLKHFLDILYILNINNTTLAGVNDITGTPRTLIAISDINYGYLQVGSPPGPVLVGLINGNPASALALAGHNIGIVIGTGGGVVTPTQDALQAKIAHGEAAGQLLYGGCELYGLTFANPNGQFSIRRYFTNVLGGAVTIQEVGIYSVGGTSSAATYAFCIARDVVAPGITVNNGEILEVTYVPQITV